MLANQRKRDELNGLADDECGWRNVAAAAGDVGCTVDALNTQVCKARQRFILLDVMPAAGIIERRPGQLRIGVRDISFHGHARTFQPPASGGPERMPTS